MNRTVGKVCPFCKTTTRIDIPGKAYDAWQRGELIQNAWPEGSATERETLVSGICPACQKKIFDTLEYE